MEIEWDNYINKILIDWFQHHIWFVQILMATLMGFWWINDFNGFLMHV